MIMISMIVIMNMIKHDYSIVIYDIIIIIITTFMRDRAFCSCYDYAVNYPVLALSTTLPIIP